ncbi:peptidase M23 [Hyunsoonleella flava]|uniref:Peptidase M23 n=1 Tax=Hyunsoonleella flava TaxID=2527939 RepID=A0A4Q9FHM9_9FLAO|nr:peptidoglycan DD-metalloendopeptidase family protein [Hyunsoonleella flava]TBN04883.1 peptidase M23 [Hyunsoonleella flava]
MTSSEFCNFLKSISSQPLHVLDASIPKSKYVAIDLSEGNVDLQNFNISSSEAFSIYIDTFIEKHDAAVAYGGYLEKRAIYSRSKHFDDTRSKRDIHLGLDFWCAAETPIYAPLDGIVHSFRNNSNYGDYGPTIILEHCILDEVFYTLYGHLSLKSIKNLKVGQRFNKNEQIATLGDARVNGDYPPHLHFQVIRNLQGSFGDYPGVCSKQDLEFYMENCPNPELLFSF